MTQLKIVDNKALIKADPKKNYALRIFKDNEQVAYKSTRLGDLHSESDGVSFDCPEEFIGLDYELKVLTGKVEVVEKGKLEVNKSEAKKLPEKKELKSPTEDDE